MKYLFTIFFFCGIIHPQISITQNDVMLCNTVGTISVSSFDSNLTAVDIGIPGESSWDFSALGATWSYNVTVIDPSTSPYHGSFSNSAVCRSYTTSTMGFQSDHWIFNSLTEDGFFLDGNVSASGIVGFTVSTRTTYNPSEEQIRIPLTYGTSWSQDYSYTTVSSTGGPSVTTNLHTTYTVDAYGKLTFPGGGTNPALRMKRDETSITSSVSGQTYSRNIGYIFYTKSGNSISVSAADTLQADHGVINVSGAGWVIGTTTDVSRTNDLIPAKFELSQNYPNPFNPTTNLSFAIGHLSFVSLKVYDVLGNEVAALVDEEKPAGIYKIEFKASGLSSGTYFYQLKAGQFVDTKKLVLLK